MIVADQRLLIKLESGLTKPLSKKTNLIFIQHFEYNEGKTLREAGDMMPNKVENVLIPSLFQTLQTPSFVTISTVDFETGGPNVTAISWILAKSDQLLLFAIDNRSRIMNNMKSNNQLVVTLFAEESVYAITGTATVLTNKLNDVPLKLALLQIDIQEVRDVMFYGSKIVSQPSYDRIYDKKSADKLDQQVISAIWNFK